MASFSKATDLFTDLEKDRRQQTRAAAANGGLCEVVYRLTRVGRYGMHRLKEVMQVLIAADGPLGTEWLAHLLFWNRFDLARTFNEFRNYRNAHRVHRSFGGSTPVDRVAGSARA